MNYKFEVGDIVKIVEFGRGVNGESLEEFKKTHPNEFTIVRQGKYFGECGYIIFPPIGNSETGEYDCCLGESTFKLVRKKEIFKSIKLTLL